MLYDACLMASRSGIPARAPLPLLGFQACPQAKACHAAGKGEKEPRACQTTRERRALASSTNERPPLQKQGPKGLVCGLAPFDRMRGSGFHGRALAAAAPRRARSHGAGMLGPRVCNDQRRVSRLSLAASRFAGSNADAQVRRNRWRLRPRLRLATYTQGRVGWRPVAPARGILALGETQLRGCNGCEWTAGACANQPPGSRASFTANRGDLRVRTSTLATSGDMIMIISDWVVTPYFVPSI